MTEVSSIGPRVNEAVKEFYDTEYIGEKPETVHLSLAPKANDTEYDVDGIVQDHRRLMEQNSIVNMLTQEERDFVRVQTFLIAQLDAAIAKSKVLLSRHKDTVSAEISQKVVWYNHMLQSVLDVNTKKPLKSMEQLDSFIDMLSIMWRKDFSHSLDSLEEISIADLKIGNVYFAIFDMIPDVYMKECVDYYIEHYGDTVAT